MRYKLTIRQIPDLSVEDRTQLGRLSRRGGILAQDFTSLLRLHRLGGPLPTHRLILAHWGEKIFGWAIILQRNKRLTDLMIYVMREHRRKGIGSRLANAARELYATIGLPPLQVYLVDDQGDFYAKLNFVKEEEYQHAGCGRRCSVRKKRRKQHAA